MPAFDYAEMAALALELLTEFGDTGTLTRRGAGSTLNSDGSATASPGAPVPLTMMEIVGGTRQGLANAGAQSQQEGVKQFDATHIAAAVDPAPEVSDFIDFNGEKLLLKDVRTLKPAGTALVHFMNCARP